MKPGSACVRACACVFYQNKIKKTKKQKRNVMHKQFKDTICFTLISQVVSAEFHFVK